MQSDFQNNSISLLYFHKSLKYDALNTNQKPHIYQFYVYLLMFLTESLLCPLCPLDPEGRRQKDRDGHEVRFSFTSCQHQVQYVKILLTELTTELFLSFCRRAVNIFWVSKLQTGGKNITNCEYINVTKQIIVKERNICAPHCWQTCWLGTTLCKKSLKPHFFPLSRAVKIDDSHK